MQLTGESRTLSRFELGVSIIIISILFVYLVEKFSDLTTFTEQTGVSVIIRNMHSNLDLYKADRIIKGQYTDLDEILSLNPVGTVFPPPDSYRGEFNRPNPERFQPGDWYFDAENKYLVYHVINSDRFIGGATSPPRIRLRLEPVYRDINNNTVYDPGVDTLSGLGLNIVEPYQWQ